MVVEVGERSCNGRQELFQLDRDCDGKLVLLPKLLPNRRLRSASAIAMA